MQVSCVPAFFLIFVLAPFLPPGSNGQQVRESLPVAQAGEPSGLAQIGIFEVQIVVLVRPRGNDNAAIAEHLLDRPEFVDEIGVSLALRSGVNLVSARARVGGELLFPINDTISDMERDRRGHRSFRKDAGLQQEDKEHQRSNRCEQEEERNHGSYLPPIPRVANPYLTKVTSL